MELTISRTQDIAVVAQARRQRGRDARRESILAAARSTFSARGSAGSTMEEVALQAEITKPTLYDYFRTKNELETAGARGSRGSSDLVARWN